MPELVWYFAFAYTNKISAIRLYTNIMSTCSLPLHGKIPLPLMKLYFNVVDLSRGLNGLSL
jgi:hypothetical protein